MTATIQPVRWVRRRQRNDADEAKSLYGRAADLVNAGHSDDGLGVLEEVQRRFSGHHDAVVRAWAANARVTHAVVLGQEGRFDEAIAEFEGAAAELATDSAEMVRVHAANAIVNRGLALAHAGRGEEAEACLDSVVQRFGTETGPGFARETAIALSNRANLLVKLRRFDDAMAAADDVIAQFGDKPEVRERVAAAFATKAAVAATRDTADAVLAELTSRYAADEDAEVRSWVATAWDGYGQLLATQGRTDDATRAFEEVDRLFGADPELAADVGSSLYNAGIAARDAGRLKDAAGRLAAVAQRYDALEGEDIRRLVVRCLFNLGIVLRDDGEAVRARATFSEIVLRFHADTDDEIVSRVARSFDELACDDSELTVRWATVADVMRRRVS